MIAQQHAGEGQFDQLLNFATTQGRNRGDDNRAGLEDAEPARHQPLIIGGAQHDSVAGHDAEIVDEHLRDLIRAVQQLTVGPAWPVRGMKCRPVGTEAVRRLGDQFGCGIELLRVLHLGNGELEGGP